MESLQLLVLLVRSAELVEQAQAERPRPLVMACRAERVRVRDVRSWNTHLYCLVVKLRSSCRTLNPLLN